MFCSRERGCCPGRHSLRFTIYGLGGDRRYCPHSYGHFCEFCTTSIPVQRTSLSYVRHSYPYPELPYDLYARATIPRVRGQHFIPARIFRKFCTPVPQYPGLLEVLEDFHTRTRNFCEFCMTFITASRTCVSSVRPVPQYPGYGYSIFCTRPELL